MKAFITSVVLVVGATLVAGQRPFFAGSKPIGYPELATTEGLVDRFGEVDGTTQRLPIEANGDRDLIDRLSKLPIDKQPFWFINWQALEAHRQNPQTYPQRPSPFVPPNAGSGSSNFGIGTFDSGSTNSVTANTNSETSSTNSGTSITNSGTASTNSGTPVVNPGTSNSNSGSNAVGSSSSVASSNINTENRFGADNVKPTATVPNSQVIIHGNFRPNTGNTVPNKNSNEHGKPL